jgi:hypothetical protein
LEQITKKPDLILKNKLLQPPIRSNG